VDDHARKDAAGRVTARRGTAGTLPDTLPRHRRQMEVGGSRRKSQTKDAEHPRTQPHHRRRIRSRASVEPSRARRAMRSESEKGLHGTRSSSFPRAPPASAAAREAAPYQTTRIS
jgi:hypothetical protein